MSLSPTPAATCTLPWPPKALHPNARVHWATLAEAKKGYRWACYILALKAKIKMPANAKPLVALEFVPPDKRRRDLDGMLSAIKSGLDGLADAIGCDDSRWRLSLAVAPEIGGCIRVTVSE